MTYLSDPTLAGLLATVIESRYPNQPFQAGEREEWLRAALESDPIVLLEAAWEWWTEGTKGYRPTPGALKDLAREWPVDPMPYVPIRAALDAEESPGLTALIERFGRKAFGEVDRTRVLPSEEQKWSKVNMDHRRYVLAKKRMEERSAEPWNPAEIGKLPLSRGLMLALTSPAVADEGRRDSFNARLSGLADSKRLR